MIRSIVVRFVFNDPRHEYGSLTVEELLDAIRATYGQESGVLIEMIEADES